MSHAVVLVDVQRDFLDRTAPPGVGSWEKAFCVSGIQRLLEHARDRQWQVVHVGTQHADRRTLPLHHQRNDIDLYCQEGTAGSEFVISPHDGEPVFYKHWYSAFDSDLENHVDPATTIVWAGVASDCCIQQSAFEADRLERHSIVPFQAVSASHKHAFVGSLVGMAKSVCDVVDLDDIIGGTADPPPLEEHAIEARSAAWYDHQRALLGETGNVTLEAVLERLGARPAAER